MGLNPWIGLNRLQLREREAGAELAIRSHLKWDMLSSLSHNHPNPTVIIMDQRMTERESLPQHRFYPVVEAFGICLRSRHEFRAGTDETLAVSAVESGKIRGSLVNHVWYPGLGSGKVSSRAS